MIMSLSQRILKLHAKGLSTREIAEKVYALPTGLSGRERDTAITRQRLGGTSDNDIRYVKRRFGGSQRCSLREAERRRNRYYTPWRPREPAA
jgi:hypothetical protein